MFRIRPRSVAVLAACAGVACTVQRVRPPESGALDDHTAHMSMADMRAPAIVQQGSTYQGTPGLPPSNTQAPARLAASPRHGEWVKFAWEPGSPDSIEAWVVYPSTRTKAPVVVVVQEIFGLSTWIRGVADQVAADGFIAIAPDFESKVRGGPSTVELSGDSARKLIGGVHPADINMAIIAAANYAMMQPAAEQKYAVIGYCWGGSATWDHVINGGVKGFAGGVAFYGTPYMSGGGRATATQAATPLTVNVDSLQKIHTPIMLLSGSQDARITAAMPQIDSLMKALHKDYVGINYQGAIHGFLRAQDDPVAQQQGRPARDPSSVSAEQEANLAATKDGWPRTIAFLKKNLGVK